MTENRIIELETRLYKIYMSEELRNRIIKAKANPTQSKLREFVDSNKIS